MPFKIRSLETRATLPVGLAIAALAVSLGSPAATAASGDKHARPHRAHHMRALYGANRWHREVQAERLPYGPEYGFLSHVPADAIRMPGYTFVPGVGILGEACDLPTSACSDRFRDVQ